MGCPLLCLTMFALLASSYAQPLCTLILPDVLRVETEETIIVDAHGQNTTFDADIHIEDFPQKQFSLAKAMVSVNSDNDYLGIVKLTIPSKDLLKDPKKKQYVYVSVKSPSCPLEKVVLLALHSGHIFIQTDKTIYTPGSQVNYRIFSMNYNLQPLSKEVIVEFLTPEGIIVKRETLRQESKSGIISHTYKLPDPVSLGIWIIAAKHKDSPEQNHSTHFEVKEFVLPSFEVSLLPRQNYFYANDNTYEVDIRAKFLYGKPVEAEAFVLFGVKKNGVKRLIPDTVRRISIENGEGECSLERTDFIKYFKNEDDMLQYTLYVSVTVITSPGSEVVEAELENIHIVTTPYKVHFTKTSKYFKPGMPVDIMVFVTNPDGSPANRIPVVAEPGRVEGTTQGDGSTRLTLNTAPRTNALEITVKTASPALPPDRQASATMTAIAYKPLGGIENFLHIGVTGSELKPGENTAVNFNIRNSDLATQNQIQHFTYVIINKGRIMTVARQPRQADQSLVSMSLAVTKNHIPSFRIVAYYIVQTSAGREIVSDSVWVDVKDTCMGTLVVTGDKESDNRVQKPSSQLRIKLRADHKATVGLVAMDKDAYELNKRFKITQSKVWDSVEQQDIGCTPGGGADSVGVFSDAGLAVHTNFNISTAQRTELRCPAPPARRRRSSEVIIEFKLTKASNYQGHVRTCCEDGMKESPMGHSCERRSQKILHGKECADAFLDCCKHFEKKVDEGTIKDEGLLVGGYKNYKYIPDADIVSRSEFPDSWFWKLELMNERPDSNGISTKVLPVFLKDSITTWEVLAVSLSENKGICVSEPYEIQVMKEFFLDMRLPYSVVRNEQVEIRCILHNYGADRIKVRVELTHSPEFCSLSTSKKKFSQEIYVGGHSSAVASFVIVPLNLGDHEIEVKAEVPYSLVSDGVRKKLKVVPEGVRVVQTIKSVTLEPQVKGVDGVQSEKVSPLDVKNIVPRTDVKTVITVTGTPISLMVEDAIEGNNLNHLITVPGGCGEQNMIGITPSVIATRYLDATNQWEKVGLNRREQAIRNIWQGYTQQLTYHKPDNSFSAYQHHLSSTWLTAYVAKVFAMAQTMVDIDSNVLCGAIKWLTLERQTRNGLFEEKAPVIMQQMSGGIRGSTEPDAALTAFVLIALLESEKMCTAHVNNFSIKKAAHFLLVKYPTLRKPYTVAITSYALAKAGFLNETVTLLAASTGNTYWLEEGAPSISLEATGYGLLALLELKQYQLTATIVRWLTEQRFYGRLHGSTQATIIYFQALAQYQEDVSGITELDLNVSLRLPERNQPITYRIDTNNAMLARSAETRVHKGFIVDAKGKGQGTLTVMTVYHALATEKEKKCNNFDLSVKVRELEEFKIYTSSHYPGRPEGAVSTLSLEICYKHLKDNDATMSIIDISMLTGFTPDVEALKKLSRGVDKYISKFEINKQATERGTLIIYLDTVSHKEEECVKVISHQMFRVGLIQPASVTLYDYYNPDSRCSKFYHLNEGNALLGRICQGEVCRCAEENCYMRQHVDDEITAEWRLKEACAPRVDYVYKATLQKVEHNDNYDNYIMKIVQVIKEGTDADTKDQERNFISHRTCRDKLEMKRGQDYLIWGVTGDLWLQPSGYSYIIGKDTWIEWWPNERGCQDPENEHECDDFLLVYENLELVGCPT